jgi:hypothetical protein
MGRRARGLSFIPLGSFVRGKDRPEKHEGGNPKKDDESNTADEGKKADDSENHGGGKIPRGKGTIEPFK